MKRILTAILSAILLFGLITHKPPVEAYWASDILTAEVTTTVSITIGEWDTDIYIPEYEPNKIYQRGDVVFYNGQKYRARKTAYFSPGSIIWWIEWERI